MLEFLYQIDFTFFQFINTELKNDFFDIIMPFLREKRNWIPLYILIAILLFYKFSYKKAILYILFSLATIGVSDTLSSKIIKPSFERPRPCHLLEDQKGLHLMIPCGGGYSFTSSHATNHFAIGTFLGFILLPLFKRSLGLFLAWAGSISFAQVYVGVHYPFDVICGGILGFIIGYLLYNIVTKITSRETFA